MKHLFKLLVLCCGLCMVSCYDDSALWESLNDHEQRLVELETACNQMNINISSLQYLIEALEGNEYVTDVTPIIVNGEEIGYNISFTSGKSITIYHGTDGHTPVIGVSQDYDGTWYWTLDGTWLRDDHGNRIPTTGDEGNDGITPRLKIENDDWYVSYDNGATWNYLYKAVGEDGDSFFESVTADDNKVTLVLKDGTVIEIPKHIPVEFDLVFESTENIFCEYGTPAVVDFKITGGEISQINTLGENGWTATVEVNKNSKTGSVKIYAPETSATGKILIFATDTYGHLIMRALTFTDKLMEIPTLSYNVPKAGGKVEVKLSTNLEYDVLISSNASSWIEYVSTKAVRNETLTFKVSANNSTLGRTGDITIRTEDGSIKKTIVIYQEGDRYYSTGSGTETDPYIVESTGQWENLANMVNNGNSFKNTYFKLGMNLDFANATIPCIGSVTAPFSGTFDGNDKTIANMNISGTDYLGLFGYLSNATVTDFNIESVTISGSDYKGIVAGYSYNSTIKNIYATGTIKSGDYIGGITGYAENTSIDRCESEVSVGNTNSQYAGGIAGYMESSHISNSINSGRMVGFDCMGGIAGYVDSTSSIKNCFNDAQFTQGYLDGSIGGIVGYNCGTLCACSMNSSINGTPTGSWSTVGAIIGYNHTSAVCRYCYFIKQSIINKNINRCGDLDWGTWYYSGTYDAYGTASNGYPVTTMLNEWVRANSSSSMKYESWSGGIPRFEL